MEVFNAVDPEEVMITGIRAKVIDFFTKLVYSGFSRPEQRESFEIFIELHWNQFVCFEIIAEVKDLLQFFTIETLYVLRNSVVFSGHTHNWQLFDSHFVISEKNF